jgi:hypothetical protein
MPDGSPWPKVSIVTPSYNQGQFIEETIRSVLLQGYPNLEYIIMDGGSTDESVAVIRKYAPWLAHWVSEPDGGQSEAINKGFAQATGEVIAWLNSDDFYEPEVFSQAVAFFTHHLTCYLLYGDCHLVKETGEFLGLNFCRDYDRALLLERNFISQPTAFFRRETLGLVGMLNESLHYCMDLDLWLRIAYKGLGIQRLKLVLANYRLEANTKTVAEPTGFWQEKIPFIEAYIAQDEGLTEHQIERIRRHLHYMAGVAYCEAKAMDIASAQAHLAIAFQGNQLPAYDDVSTLAEELVTFSYGKLKDRSLNEQDMFLSRFFSVMPEKLPIKRLIQTQVITIQTFAAYKQKQMQEVRHRGRQVLRVSSSARRNVGLWKIVLKAHLMKAGG